MVLLLWNLASTWIFVLLQFCFWYSLIDEGFSLILIDLVIVQDSENGTTLCYFCYKASNSCKQTMKFKKIMLCIEVWLCLGQQTWPFRIAAAMNVCQLLLSLATYLHSKRNSSLLFSPTLLSTVTSSTRNQTHSLPPCCKWLTTWGIAAVS